MSTHTPAEVLPEVERTELAAAIAVDRSGSATDATIRLDEGREGQRG